MLAPGGTRVMVVEPDDGGSADDELGDDGFEDAGVEDGRLDDGGLDDDGFPDGGLDEDPDGWDEGTAPEQDVAPVGPAPPHLRAGSVLAVAGLLTALGASRPGLALAVATVLVVLARSVGLDMRALRSRRLRRGEHRGDVARAVVGWPWYLVRGLAGALPAVLVAASTVLVVGGVGWWLVDSGRLHVADPAPGTAAGALDGNAPWVVHALLALAVGAGLLVLWFGPLSRTTRQGARWALAALAPGRAGAATLVLLAIAGTAALLTLLVLGQDVAWWPLPGPPDLR